MKYLDDIVYKQMDGLCWPENRAASVSKK